MDDSPAVALVPVADRVWVGYAECNAVVVAGTRGVVLVDAPAARAGGDGLVEAIRRLDAGDLLAVVLTHGHPDHVAGLPALSAAWPELAVHAHETVRRADVGHAFSGFGVVDAGGRLIELVHPGRGHTDGDVVVRVPDADVVAIGDLASGDGVLDYGPDCWPLDWPATLDLAVGATTARTTVVPGHGPAVGRPDLETQYDQAATVSGALLDLAGRRTPPAEALTAVAWPFPADRMRHAVERGLAQAPRPRLPLV